MQRTWRLARRRHRRMLVHMRSRHHYDNVDYYVDDDYDHVE
jgi:hypothetical protein